jgi:hypothetical protein
VPATRLHFQFVTGVIGSVQKSVVACGPSTHGLSTNCPQFTIAHLNFNNV